MSKVLFVDKTQGTAYDSSPLICNADDINQLKRAINNRRVEELTAVGGSQVITLQSAYDTPLKGNVEVYKWGVLIRSTNLSVASSTTIMVDASIPLEAGDEITVKYNYTP